jgi:23S rRNA (cytidine1920-2'-O)/16S rRNA (cytidine1409-2'-O)-methyltransferase
MTNDNIRMAEFVSRGGLKLDHALTIFGIDAAGKICADLGCSTGGFTDCLLHRGALKVYAVDAGYGVLDWKLRKDSRVVVMERTNGMHVQLPEVVGIVTIDISWTRQKNILPSARKLLGEGGTVVSLIKPHYEADRGILRKGVVPEEVVDSVVEMVRAEIAGAGWVWEKSVRSPIKGGGGNVEVLVHLRPRS